MTAHVHADSMMEYAKDAAETDKPWLRWQVYDKLALDAAWKDLKTMPEWREYALYRRKPQTITINGVDVPRPEYRDSQIKDGTNYWMPNITSHFGLVLRSVWYGNSADMTRMDRGLVHLDHKSAMKHALALLSLTMIEAEDNDDDPDPALTCATDAPGMLRDIATSPMHKYYLVNPPTPGPALPILERVECPKFGHMEKLRSNSVEAVVKAWYFPGGAASVCGTVDAVQESVKVVLRYKDASVALPEHFAKAVEIRWRDIARQIIDEHQKTVPVIFDNHANLFRK